MAAQESTRKRVSRETNERIVLRAYSGAKTEDESKEVLRRCGLEESQARKIRKDLEGKGRLVRITRNPNKWIPRDELVLSHLDSKDDKRDELEDIPEYVPTLLAEKVLKDIGATIDEIDEDSLNWTKLRKISKICKKRIAPLCDSIMYLYDTLGYSITPPYVYFEDLREKKLPRWKRVLGLPDTRGIVGVGIPSVGMVSSSGRDASSLSSQVESDKSVVDFVSDVVFPDLLDWRRYLFKVRDEVEIELKKKGVNPCR